MELIPLLRRFWRRRLLMGAGVLLAVAILVGLGGTKPVSTTSALATTAVVLDTPQSQLVASAPAGADTLAWRAQLLASLMATQSSREGVARRLGVSAADIAVVDPTLTLPLVDSDTAAAASKVASEIVTPYVLTPFLPNSTLPMISIQAAAPTKAGAERLAQAAVAVLQSHGSNTGRYKSLIITGAVGTPTLQAFAVDQVAPVQVKLVSSSSISLKAIGGAMIVLLASWAAALLLPMPRRPRRGAGKRALPVA